MRKPPPSLTSAGTNVVARYGPMFQLFIDKVLDREDVEAIAGSFFGNADSLVCHRSLEALFDALHSGDGGSANIGVFIRPFSARYPLMIEIWPPRFPSSEEDFARHFSRLADCHAIITDDQINPYSWRCVLPSGEIEAILLSDADLGTNDD